MPASGREVVPRERMVTRERKHVTPEKEEQGSGAVRFHVEKNDFVGETSVEYWNDLKSALRKRHIPSYYERELMDMLQRLR